VFHDLGYPWEISPSLERADAFLAPFADLNRYAAKDGALFALSQLLAFQWIRTEEPSSAFRKEVLPYLRRSRPAQASLFTLPDRSFLEDWDDAERLPATADAGLWRLICVIVPEADRLSVLETVAEGRPVASTHPALHSLLPLEPRMTLGEGLTEPDRFAWMASNNEVPIHYRTQFRWAHYARSLEQHFGAFLDSLFPPAKSKANELRNFLVNFLATFEGGLPATDDLYFDDCAYAMFYQLLKELDFDDQFDVGGEGTLFLHDRFAQSELSGLQGRLLDEGLLDEVTSVIRELLEAEARALDAPAREERINVTTRKLDLYLKELLKGLPPRDRLAKIVEKRLTRQIKERITLKQKLYEIYTTFKKQILQRLADDLPPLFPQPALSETAPAAESRTLDWKAFGEYPVAAGLNEMLIHQRLGGLSTLEQYRPHWAPHRPNVAFADHGLASGLTYVHVRHSLSKLSDFSAPGRPTSLLRLVHLRGATERALAPPRNGHDASLDVLYSIMLHNLYPAEHSAANDKAFRVKVDKKEKDAFTYFALLCDSLQPWDRKRLFNPATGSVPYTTYAEDFNIEIYGNVLRISERGDKLRLEERQAALRDFLDLFLQNASSAVQLHLAEWR
jgi:hypothetical protein